MDSGGLSIVSCRSSRPARNSAGPIRSNEPDGRMKQTIGQSVVVLKSGFPYPIYKGNFFERIVSARATSAMVNPKRRGWVACHG